MRRDEVLQHREALTEVGRDGRLDDFAGGLGHEAAHAGQLADLGGAAAGARIGHHVDGVEALEGSLLAVGQFDLFAADRGEHLGGDLLGGLGPDVDDLVVALAVGDEPVHVLLLHLEDVLVGLGHDVLLARRDHHVVDGDGGPGDGGVLEAHVLEAVGQDDGGLVAAAPVAEVDEVGDLLFVHDLVDDLEGDLLRYDIVKEDPAHRGLGDVSVHADLDPGLEIRLARVEGLAQFLGAREDHVGAAASRAGPGHVVEPQDDVLGGHDDGLAVGRRQDVVRRHHEHAGLHLRLDGERHVDRHLVAVEIGVEGRADERVELDGLALDESGLEGLHAQPVQGGGAVEDDGVLAHHIVQGVPDLGGLALDHLLGAFHRRHVALVHEAVVDEGLEELECHLLGKTALVEPQVGPHGDDGAARVVDALAQQVLAEAALLSLQHVRKRAQGALVGARDGPAAPAVVEEHVDGLLEHPFLVADDDLGGIELHEPLQAVVAVDDATVQVIEVGGGEAPSLQGNERP